MTTHLYRRVGFLYLCPRCGRCVAWVVGRHLPQVVAGWEGDWRVYHCFFDLKLEP